MQRIQIDRDNESKEQQLRVISAAQKRCHYGEIGQTEDISECMNREKEYYRNNAKEYLSQEDFDNLPDSDKKQHYDIGGKKNRKSKRRKSKRRKSKRRKSKSRKN
jgi:hypothetical protein